MRTVVKVYTYECDVQAWTNSCDAEQEVTTGDAIPQYEGATWPDLAGRVRTAEDADKVMRLGHRWHISRNFQACPKHHPKKDNS